jgi:hypothetical protein
LPDNRHNAVRRALRGIDALPKQGIEPFSRQENWKALNRILTPANTLPAGVTRKAKLLAGN